MLLDYNPYALRVRIVREKAIWVRIIILMVGMEGEVKRMENTKVR